MSVINDGNNIHIKSIKSIFQVWCISAIIIVHVDHLIQWITNSVTGNLYTEARIFTSVHRDFGRSPSLMLTVVKWRSSHTLAGGLLLVLLASLHSTLSKLHFCRFKCKKSTYFSEHLSPKGNRCGKWLGLYSGKSILGENKSQIIGIYFPKGSVHLRERVWVTWNLEKLLDDRSLGDHGFLNCSECCLVTE